MQNSTETQPAPDAPRGNNNLILGAALGVVLILGVTAGYLFSRVSAQPVQVVVTATPEPDAQAATPTDITRQSGATASTATPSTDSNTASTPTIMDLVLADARHFQGQADAPVTLVEFSDFK